MTTQRPFEQTLEDFEMLVFDSVHRFRRSHGSVGSLEDMLNDGMYFFVIAYATWKKDRSSFQTWLPFVIYKGFLESRRRYARRAEKYPREPGEYNLTEIPSHRNSFCPYRFAGELSPDAREAIDETLRLEFCRNASRLNKRRALFKVLLGKGWEESRIETVFNEIQEAL